MIGRDLVIGSRVADRVHSIGPTRRGLPKGGFSRCYLFEYDEGLVLVDTGWDTDAGMILKYLARIGRSPQEITHIAITHGHRSHLGGVKRLRDLSRAQVCSHASEAPIVAGERKAHPIAFWPPLPVALIPFRIISHLPIFEHDPCPVPRHLVDGDEVGPLRVVHTPGHTDGHLAFSYEDDAVIAVGDAVATWPRFGAGWPGFNLHEQQYRASLVTLVERAPSAVGPGHGVPIVAHTARRLRTLIRGRRFAKARARTRS